MSRDMDGMTEGILLRLEILFPEVSDFKLMLNILVLTRPTGVMFARLR